MDGVVVNSSSSINGYINTEVDELNAEMSDQQTSVNGTINTNIDQLIATINDEVSNLQGTLSAPYLAGSSAKFITDSPITNPIGLFREGETYTNNTFTVSDAINYILHSDNQSLDYSIKSITGSTDSPISLDELPSGIYRIKGDYFVLEHRMKSISDNYSNLFIVNHEELKIIRIDDQIDLIYLDPENNKYYIYQYALDKDIPKKVSELSNDVGYITNEGETDPTVPSWAKQQNKPTYSAEEIGAINEDNAIPLADIAALFNN